MQFVRTPSYIPYLQFESLSGTVQVSQSSYQTFKYCRLMAACDTDDPEAPLTYKQDVFMLLGRKPREPLQKSGQRAEAMLWSEIK